MTAAESGSGYSVPWVQFKIDIYRKGFARFGHRWPDLIANHCMFSA
jgi:hypothetical protein